VLPNLGGTAGLAPSVWASGQSGSTDDQLERMDTLQYVIYYAIGTSCVSQVVVVFVVSGRFFDVHPQELGPINCCAPPPLEMESCSSVGDSLRQLHSSAFIHYSFQGGCMGPCPQPLNCSGKITRCLHSFIYFALNIEVSRNGKLLI
jgi:hypothetical protein